MLVKARCLPEVDVTEGRPVDSPVCSPKGLWLKSPSQRWAGGADNDAVLARRPLAAPGSG